MSTTRNSLKLGETLRLARKNRGWSQTELARNLGFKSGQCISDWERHRGSRIPVGLLKKIADLLEIDGEKLFEVYISDETEKLLAKLKHEWNR